MVIGALVVMWHSRQRLPDDLKPDVLAALSETEALSPQSIRRRPPLDYQDVDLRTLEAVLDHLCSTGQAVRWFESANGVRQIVYRRIKSAPETAA